MLGRPARLVRALAVSAAILTFSATAHTQGGAALPALPWLAGLTAVLLLVVAPLTARRMRPLTLLALLGAGQFVLHHALLLLGSGPSRCVPVQLHAHHTVLDCSGALAEPATAHGIGTAMLLWHLLATLASAAAITHGETVLRALLAAVRPLFALTARVEPPALAPRPRVSSHPWLPSAPVFRLTAPTRGPPLACC